MTSFKPRLASLPAPQRKLWRRLAPARRLGLVLYGGTAVALRLGHRQSVDFDFFTDARLDKDRIVSAMPFLSTADRLQDQPDTLSILADGVKFSFFGGLGFGRYSPPQTTSDGVLLVASLDDLLALKLKAILEREEARDYRDIAEMLRAGVSLARGLAIAEDMFRPQLAPMTALRALTYFKGGDLETLSRHDMDALASAAAQQLLPLPKVARAGRRLAPPEE